MRKNLRRPLALLAVAVVLLFALSATALAAGDLTDGSIGILELMLKCGLVPSKGEARRLVQQGGVEVAGEKVKEISTAFSAEQLAGEGLVIKKGKKVFHRAYLEG